VQNAFKDVHDAMNNVDAGRQLVESTTVRINALRETLRLADLRYKAGYTGYLEVLNAQRDLMQAESGLIDVQRNQLTAVVSLYKALGGGWDSASIQSAAR
jgi:multidrug efflux system outer membrane protein